MKKCVLGFAIVGVLFGVSNLFGQARLTSRFGEKVVGGKRLIVHVTVAIPDGWDENAIADDAVRGQGARPIQPSAFTLEGIRWDQFSNGTGSPSVPLNYNPAGEPLAALTSLTSAPATCTTVRESTFPFSHPR